MPKQLNKSITALIPNFSEIIAGEWNIKNYLKEEFKNEPAYVTDKGQNWLEYCYWTCLWQSRQKN